VECERNKWSVILKSGMTRNVTRSGKDQEKCERNRSQEECERNRRAVRGTGGM